MLQPQHTWRLFDDVRAAFAWLQRPDSMAAYEAVTHLVAEAHAVTPLLIRLRAELRRRNGGLTLEDAARLLRTSSRSLQRELQTLGTSFRGERELSQVQAAYELLAGTDTKIEAVARMVGCASLGAFSRLFRRHTGTSPSAFRIRSRT